jgi:flagellar motor switch protein FliG
MASDIQFYSGARKAAIFIATMGAEVAASVFKNLDDAEITTLSTEISHLPVIDEEVTSEVLQEFLQMAVTGQYITTGGMNFAVELLDKALGKNRAAEIANRIEAASQPTSFAAVKKADPKHLTSILRREHPQTVALVLANLEPTSAAAILAGLPDELRAEVVIRLATIDKASPEVIKQIERVLEKQVSVDFASGATNPGGALSAAKILNQVDLTTQKTILNRLDETSPSLAEQIRAMMFTFDDLYGVDDRGMQQIIQEVDQKQLVLALKGASGDIVTKIFNNMSERTASIVKQEIEFLGPVRLRDVEDAQRRIVAVARKLEESGDIILSKRGAGDPVLG